MSISLDTIFADTLSPDASTRIKSENQLSELSSHPGFLRAVLGSLELNKPTTVQHSASIYLKNLITSRWASEDENVLVFSRDEKQKFSAHLIDILMQAPRPIEKQLLSILSIILAADYPNEWPTFFDSILQLINSNHHQQAQRTGMNCLLQLITLYQWKMKPRREELEKIITKSFSTLLKLAQRVLISDDASSLELLRIILKCYKKSIMMELSIVLQQADSIVPWVTLLLSVVEKPVAQEILNLSIEEQQNEAIWKCKKWAFSSLNRLYLRYGEPSQISGEAAKIYKPFAIRFSTDLAPQIFSVYMNFLSQWMNGILKITDKCLYLIGTYIEECVRAKSMWKYVKPHYQSLVTWFCFPLMCLNDSDIETFQDDPHCFINQKFDFYGDCSTPEIAASNLLLVLATKRNKVCFPYILQLVNLIVTGYEERASQYYRNDKAKDGALRMFACLTAIIFPRKEKLRHAIEDFMKIRIITELKSQSGILRARACETLGKFSEIQFKDQNLSLSAYQGVLECLYDNSLVVKVQAALALQYLMQNEHIKQLMSKDAHIILSNLIKLANEVDIDLLGNVIEELVQAFPTEVAPFAADMIKSLSQLFFKLTSEMKDFEEVNGNIYDKSISALGVLNTIETIILNIESLPNTIKQCETTILNLVNWIFNQQLSDFYHDTFQIVDTLLYVTKSISNLMWKSFEAICNIILSEDEENFEDAVPAILNFIYYGGKDLRNNDSRCVSLIRIISQAFEKEENITISISAARTSEAMMLALPGHIDSLIPGFVSQTMKRLFSTSQIKCSDTYFVHILQITINAINYDAKQTLELLDKASKLADFFTIWLNSLHKLKRVHDKKLSAAAILAIFKLGKANVPEILQASWSQLILGYLTILKQYPEALKLRIEAESRGIDDFESNLEENSFNTSDDDDDEDFYDSQSMETELDTKLLSEQEDYNRDEAEFLLSTEESYEGDLEEDLCLHTPLDNFDPYKGLQEYIKDLQQKDPQEITTMVQALSEEQMELLKECYTKTIS